MLRAICICYNYKINILGRSRSVEARAIASTARAKWLVSYTAARALPLTFFETCVNIIIIIAQDVCVARTVLCTKRSHNSFYSLC